MPTRVAVVLTAYLRQIPLHKDGGLPRMGPMFYIVQSNGVLRPISAVLLADWPHEFQPWPSPRRRFSLKSGKIRPFGRWIQRPNP